ncbi:hypothetical protein KP509_37G062100 [Ceratopteris richardii]|uniref:Epidermal patterning factor-like protein n=1 Tax=Ceratopteris richardii TaxID=49495 RepID=A0A8T2Q9Z0_CERRI|nr:hypothetical protein KP509_37G062100 [Ceratopteris richardii]
MVTSSSIQEARVREHKRGKFHVLIIILVIDAVQLSSYMAAASPGSFASHIQRASSNYGLHQLSFEESTLEPKNKWIYHSKSHGAYRRLLIGRNGGPEAPLLQYADKASRALVGSSPPKCIKKCGNCTPCRSVLVPIHTSSLPIAPAEYYPEAWRCQCRGRIYNP